LIENGFKDEKWSGSTDDGEWLSREQGVRRATHGSGQQCLYCTLQHTQSVTEFSTSWLSDWSNEATVWAWQIKGLRMQVPQRSSGL